MIPKIQKALTTVQAFLPEDQEIVKIIQLCGLTPSESSDGWRVWQNRYSPYLRIQKNKTVVTRWKLEDFTGPHNDLFAYADLATVSQNSHCCLMISNGEYFGFLFGDKTHLRYRRYLGTQYQNKPPLHLPLADIRQLIKQYDETRFFSFKPSKGAEKGFVMSWPPTPEIVREINSSTGIAASPASFLFQIKS